MKVQRRLLLVSGALAVGALCLGVGAPAVVEPPPVQVLVQSGGDVGATVAAIRAAGGRTQLAAGGTVQALVPQSAAAGLERAPAVSDVAPAPVASADAVVSGGVARLGADELQAGGLRGAGVKIAVLDTAFGSISRLDSLAGSELPSLDRQHRRSFDATYGLSGRDFFGTTSAHGEEVAEIVYDVAPDADYWFVNYRTSLEFGPAVDYLLDEVRPDVIVHSNSFLFGPFDGTGWFARQVDRAAAQGILWVNSAGNYRLKHWEGAWTDADADGSLDVPGHDNAIPFTFAATARPACDLSWTDAGASGDDRYELRFYTDPAAEHPALDARSGQQIASSFVPEPDPHASLGPAFLPAAGTYYLRITRVGTPATARLTLFCRQELPPDFDVTPSSSPTPGDARGALSVGAFNVNTLTPPDYSTEGPTDDGRMKPDLSAATAVAVNGGYFSGTSAAAPHVAGAAALLWPQIAAAAGAGDPAARVAARLKALALDAGDPGPDERFGLGRTRIEMTPPELGTAAPPASAAVRGLVPLRFPLLETGTLDSASASLDGAPLAGLLGSDRALTATFDSRTLADGVHHVEIAASDKSGNTGRYDVPLRVDNTPPALGGTQPRAGAFVARVAKLRIGIVDAGPTTTVLAVDGRPLPANTDRDGFVTASLETTLLLDGRHVVGITSTDAAGNGARFELLLVADNTAPALRLRVTRFGPRVRVAVAAADATSGLLPAPQISFGDGTALRGRSATHRYRRPGLHRIVVRASDRADNSVRRTQKLRITAATLRRAAR